MYQAYADIFETLLKQGKTHLEAYRSFNEENLRAALRESFDNGSHQDMRRLLDLMTIAGMEEGDERDRDQCFDLWAMGWTNEKVTPTSRPMSWYWRAPAKGKRKLGRRYLSTNQAWMAMKRGK